MPSKTKQNKTRCPWPGNDELMIQYHDKEWGLTQRDDGMLFEYFLLDTFQAGLSWSIILNKRKNFRKAFSNFNPKLIIKYDSQKIKQLLSDSGIIRNQLKIKSAISNSQAFLEVQKEFGSFADYIWQFVKNKPKQNAWKTLKQIPARTKESDLLSEDLKKRGFKFVGSTIVYAFMQGVGLVNDHLVSCFRYKEVSKK